MNFSICPFLAARSIWGLQNITVWATGVNIRIICWFTPPNLWDYYAFCEEVNLEIFRAFEEQAIQFSLPLRHSYWKHDEEQGPLEVEVMGGGVTEREQN